MRRVLSVSVTSQHQSWKLSGQHGTLGQGFQQQVGSKGSTPTSPTAQTVASRPWPGAICRVQDHPISPDRTADRVWGHWTKPNNSGVTCFALNVEILKINTGDDFIDSKLACLLLLLLRWHGISSSCMSFHSILLTCLRFSSALLLTYLSSAHVKFWSDCKDCKVIFFFIVGLN